MEETGAPQALNGTSSSSSGGGVHVSRHRPPRPDYGSSIVREALVYLASIELIELCHEAKVEHCRATRDLSSCGRYVQFVLTSCGHASLCAECSQRCDICPICRTSIPKNGSQIQLRLYNKCIEAGLISKRLDDRFQENKHDGKYMMADVQRLYSLFDVALENNLVSLVCHYVTDVCMDESAVSSDPVLAFLLDEVVVEDWCKQKFRAILSHLHEIYALGVEEMDARLSSIQNFGLQLSGLSSVMEVLESSSVQALTERLHGLHQLSDSIWKAKQHLEVMTWCIRHKYLENVRYRFNYISWRSQFDERKTAAMKRAWPDFTGNSAEQNGSTLFIEDALSNLGVEQEFENGIADMDVSCLQADTLFTSAVNGSGSYPFRNLREAADILFLRGTSDMMVAKQATFLYYLFDRHWTMPESAWRHIIDDFAASFGISQHSVLESLSFYLLDDHTEQALQEVERLLPEIAGPETHPKIAQVLLERQRPDIALMVLRCSGCDGFSGHASSKYDNVRLVSLGEAVTAVRVRIEFGLLTEAFMYQRMHCIKVKEEKTKDESQIASSTGLKSKDTLWICQVEVLVTEFCSLCVRRNLVDRMIELPWNSDEEKYLCKYLFDNACRNPSSMCGSLLVVFYLQRYRYTEAYQVDRKLRGLEDEVPQTDEAVLKMQLVQQWRAGLVEKGIDMLPEIQRLQAKTRKVDINELFSSRNWESLPNKVSSDGASPSSYILQQFSSKESSLLLQLNVSSLLSNEVATNKHDTSTSPVRASDSEFSSFTAPSNVRGNVSTSHQSPPIIRRTTAVVCENIPSSLCNGEITSIVHRNGVMTRAMRKKIASQQESSNRKATSMLLDGSDMDLTWSIDKRDSPARNFKTGTRWRSDESSDDEVDMSLEKILGQEGSFLTSKRRYVGK